LRIPSLRPKSKAAAIEAAALGYDYGGERCFARRVSYAGVSCPVQALNG